MHLLAEGAIAGVELVVDLAQQALLRGRQAAAGGGVRFLAGAITELLDSLWRAQQQLGLLRHGRVEGAHALARLGFVEG